MLQVPMEQDALRVKILMFLFGKNKQGLWCENYFAEEIKKIEAIMSDASIFIL